eukprot:scaffold1782_cov414-Prasinococcus_capsulatus_cf.AAC.20
MAADSIRSSTPDSLGCLLFCDSLSPLLGALGKGSVRTGWVVSSVGEPAAPRPPPLGPRTLAIEQNRKSASTVMPLSFSDTSAGLASAACPMTAGAAVASSATTPSTLPSASSCIRTTGSSAFSSDDSAEAGSAASSAGDASC